MNTIEQTSNTSRRWGGLWGPRAVVPKSINPSGEGRRAEAAGRPRPTQRLLAASILALALGLAGAAHGTVVQKQSFEQLVQKADLVAVGRVLRVAAYPTVDQQYAYTYVTVGELEVLHGAYAEAELTLRMDGGPLSGRRSLVISGMPRFSIGEKVVLFIKGNTERICPLAGWDQGVLRVVKEEPTGRELLRTSDGRRIHAIENADFAIQSDGHDALAASGGTPDEGSGRDLSNQRHPRANEDLTVGDLKREVHAAAARAGLHGRPPVAVRSAGLKLDSPAARPIKSYTGRNQP